MVVSGVTAVHQTEKQHGRYRERQEMPGLLTASLGGGVAVKSSH